MNSEFAISNLIVEHGNIHKLTLNKLMFLMYILQYKHWKLNRKPMIDSFFSKKENKPFLSGIFHKYGGNNEWEINKLITHMDSNGAKYSYKIEENSKIFKACMNDLVEFQWSSEDNLLQLIHQLEHWNYIDEGSPIQLR